MHRSQRTLWIQILMAVACLGLAASAAMAAPREDVATMTGGPTGIEWRPVVDYQRLVLTVSGPAGNVIRREFAAGESPSFSIFDKAGNTLREGVYVYELRVVPKVAPDVQRQLADARAKGEDGAAQADLRAAGKLPAGPFVQSGAFAVKDGAFIIAGQTEGGERGVTAVKQPLRPVTAADQVIPDDLIVQGSECVGLDCVNNENFGFDTIRMKENNLRVHFDDTSTSAGFPANDWRLIANDSASGGSSKFSIEDSTSAKTPFTITAGAATNSIFVDSTGRVGFRTSTPVLDLHVNTSNTPAIRLEQNNSGGFTAQTWDIGANEANFFVRDVTGGSRLSFRIRPGAPTSSVDISADGDVGIGTGSPENKLHVFGSNTADTFIGIGPNPDGSPGTESALNIGYGGTSFGRASGFFNVRPDSGATAPNPSLRFATNNIVHFTIDNNGDTGINCNDPGSDLVIASSVTGNDCPNPSSSINAGAAQFTVGSSRTFKENLTPLQVPDILDKIASVDVYHYDFINGPKDRIGLMAEDFHEIFGRGSDKYLNGDEVQVALWLAVKQLTATNQELMKRVADLESRLQAGTQK